MAKLTTPPTADSTINQMGTSMTESERREKLDAIELELSQLRLEREKMRLEILQRVNAATSVSDTGTLLQLIALANSV
jgi:hypothetical protein